MNKSRQFDILKLRGEMYHLFDESKSLANKDLKYFRLMISQILNSIFTHIVYDISVRSP